MSNELTRLATLGPLTPAKVEAVEASLLELPQVDCPVKHYFADGICIREVKLPAGSLIIGHEHRYATLNICLKGRLTLLLEDGSTREVSAPATFVGKPGRKVAYINEDVIWQNIFPTDLKDADAVEDAFLIKSNAWQGHAGQMKALEQAKGDEARADYKLALAELGMTEEEARAMTERTDDQILLPHGEYGITFRESNIEGRGTFATRDFNAGEAIGPARVGGKRTPLGRWVNHSNRPNCEMIFAENCVYLVALTAINGCEGGQPGDELTVDYRRAAVAALEANQKGKIPCPQ
jgi:hypothetical protein